ncbi:MAG: YybS family protein [Gammaproteobacteria bacterium]|nr:YybS family protein [Gammaproteobacteria bacterium]
MKFLAAYILRGQKEAVIVTAISALLSLIFFPLSYISAAAVGLVTLHVGARQGLAIAAISAAVMAVLGFFLVGSYLPAIAYLLLLWLPLWWIAGRLRRDRVLSLSLLQSAAFGVLMIAGFYLVLEDPTAWWRIVLDESFRIIFQDVSEINDTELNQVVEQIAKLMTGMMAVAFLVHLLGSLFLARWWQAALHNPGGFGREFRDVRLGRVVAGITLGLLIVSLIMGGTVLTDLLLVMGLLFMLQGIALVHGLVHNLKAHQGWLIGQYVLLTVAMPQTVMTLALAGLVDNWFNFRGFWPLKNSVNGSDKDQD